MIIESLELSNFRNYEHLKLDLCDKVNLLYGDNAQGKTNILEAIYLCATAKSHRGGKDRELILFGNDESHIKMNVKKSTSNRLDIHIKKNKSKGIAVNGIPVKKISELFGLVNVIFFSPEDLGIIKAGFEVIWANDFEKDATDRNRTAPFAFTNNKFEFRMVGSSDSIASPNLVLNTIVAESFKEAADELENSKDFFMAVHDMVKELLIKHKRIIFNGNGYSDEWVEEAKRRGLSNNRSMVDAIPALVSERSVKLFESFKVFTRAELISRAEIEYESYSKVINIEARTMIDVATKSIIPAVIHYITRLANSINSVRKALPTANIRVQTKLLNECSDLLSEAEEAMERLIKVNDYASNIKEAKKRAEVYHDEVTKVMTRLREPIDRLEMIVDKDMWPMPSYGDMIFEV